MDREFFSKIPKTDLRNKAVQDHDHNFLSHLISGIEKSGKIDSEIDRRAYFPGYRNEIIMAKSNLNYANKLFSSFENEQNMKCLVPKSIYYKTLKDSKGTETCQGALVLLDYSIFSPIGHCLAHGSNQLINLENTIPGFALGIQGMKVEETREIFIHPTYAYGYDTSLEKCLALRVIVTLQEIRDNRPYSRPIDKIDLSFISGDEELNRRTKRYKAALVEKGKQIGDHIKKCPQINLNLVCEHLKCFQKGIDKFEPTTDTEQTIINQMHWNIYFGNL